MDFMGFLLDLIARVADGKGMFEYAGFASDIDAEMGQPMFLRTVLLVGFMGLILSAYFYVIMATADSCLMATSGNVVTDILGSLVPKKLNGKESLWFWQIAMLFIGILALLLAMMQHVLELMLLSYAFLVSGLFVPVLGALFWKRGNPAAAFLAMLLVELTTTLMVLTDTAFPFGLDANIGGIGLSAVVFILLSLIFLKRVINEFEYSR
ncbi:MAG: SSS family solute:Na+ symporter [Saprospiraceae bacterium]|jgi:SSS family solute:Na+ symporter